MRGLAYRFVSDPYNSRVEIEPTAQEIEKSIDDRTGYVLWDLRGQFLYFLQNRFENIFFDEIGVRVRKFFLLGEVLRRVSAAAIK